jgi:hypothetical protein
MNAAHTLEVNAVAGLHDDFSTAASSLWAPYLANEWSVSGGLYSCSANRTIASSYNWNYNVCNYYISQTNYTVTVRQQRVTPGSNPFAILLATGNNMQGANGYLFDFSIDGDFYIDRFDNYNMVTRTGGIYTIQGWTINPAINSGLGAWNVVKVVRSGSTYTLIVNNTTVFTMNDSTYDPRYVALIHLVDSNILSQMNYDYVYIAVGSAAAAAPIPPRQALSTPSVGFDSTHRRTTGK